MLLKLVSLLLIGMAVLALFGRFRRGGKRGASRRLSAARCKACGKPLIGGGSCGCGGKA